jgi:hypothetical protein
MRKHTSRGLWIAAVALTVVTVAAVVVDPRDWGSDPPADELASTVDKAATYYEFEHYDRAAETYALAVERGMDDAIEWFRYARATERSAGLDLSLYVTAYRLLLQDSPQHEYRYEAERTLSLQALPFSYQDAQAGLIAPGTLLVVTGTIGRVRKGLVQSGVDTLLVDTKPHDWFGYFGDPVRVVAPRHARYQSGDIVQAIGWYDGWCEIDDGAGLSARYPCLIAAGVVQHGAVAAPVNNAPGEDESR